VTPLHLRRQLLRAQAQGSLAAARDALTRALTLTALVLETDPDADVTDSIVTLETTLADLAVYLRRQPRDP
jgi:hypothetical protein